MTVLGHIPLAITALHSEASSPNVHYMHTHTGMVRNTVVQCSDGHIQL